MLELGTVVGHFQLEKFKCAQMFNKWNIGVSSIYIQKYFNQVYQINSLQDRETELSI